MVVFEDEQSCDFFVFQKMCRKKDQANFACDFYIFLYEKRGWPKHLFCIKKLSNWPCGKDSCQGVNSTLLHRRFDGINQTLCFCKDMWWRWWLLFTQAAALAGPWMQEP